QPPSHNTRSTQHPALEPMAFKNDGMERPKQILFEARSEAECKFRFVLAEWNHFLAKLDPSWCLSPELVEGSKAGDLFASFSIQGKKKVKHMRLAILLLR